MLYKDLGNKYIKDYHFPILMIKDFQPRLYQQTILASAIEKNTLVVLPTGLGKTYVFLMLAAQRLKKYPDSKVLLLGPTRPLIDQYYKLFLRHFTIPENELAVFTGFVKPEIREELWKTAKIIFSTPQGLENDLISNRFSLESVSLLGLDEAHRAVGDYSYVWIAKQYTKKSIHSRIIGLTASPGSDIEKITEVCRNIYVDNVEIRTDEDPDVKPYIKDVKIKWIYVDLPPHFKRIQKYLSDCLKSKIHKIREILPKLNNPIETKRDMLALHSFLLKNITNNYENMRSLSLLAEAMKVQHALELLESQGISPLLEYLEELVAKSKTTKVKAVKNLTKDLNFKSALVLTRNLKESNIEHPKYSELKKIVTQYTKDPKKKIIVFSQYRDSITALNNVINQLPNVKSRIFVGQAKKKGSGLSQKQQLKILQEFEDNKFNVLIMSSVGEEGLDIPVVDAVIFYEPVPSAIRTIQRRGRTGRQKEGEVVILVAKGTRDEAYRWSSFHKEKRMYRILKDLKTKFAPQKREDRQITEFIMPDTGIKIYADFREKGSGIIKKLIELGADLKLEKLEIGDYLLSTDLCVEHKTVEDFVNSLIDKRLFSQLKEMKKYSKQLIVLEGEEDLYSQRKLHPNAIRGMLATICIDFGVPVISTKNTEESALLMAIIAKREQSDEKKDFTLHSTKPLTLKEQQEYIISALPGVGPVISKPLLKKFGSVKKIINAKVDDLKKVELIGDKKAAKINEVVSSKYD